MKIFFDHPDQPADEVPCWEKIQIENENVTFNTRNKEIYIHRLRLSWEEQKQKIADTINTWKQDLKAWWEEQQKKITDALKKWWEEQQKKIKDALNQWWQDFQRRLAKWFEQQLIEWLNQCCASAFLPVGVLTGVWISRRRKKRKSF